MSETSRNNHKGWVTVILLALAIPVVTYLLLDFLYAGDESKVQIYGVLSSVLAVVCVVAIIISTIATHKLKGRTRLLPVIGIFIPAIILCLSLFTAIFSGFASSH